MISRHDNFIMMLSGITSLSITGPLVMYFIKKISCAFFIYKVNIGRLTSDNRNDITSVLSSFTRLEPINQCFPSVPRLDPRTRTRTGIRSDRLRTQHERYLWFGYCTLISTTCARPGAELNKIQHIHPSIHVFISKVNDAIPITYLHQ